MRAIIGVVQIALDILPPSSGIGASQRSMGRAAGIVDENVDWPQRAGQQRECALDLVGVADVGDGMSETFGVGVEFSRETFEARFLVDGGDLRALVEEQSAQALADPARGAGDGDHLVLECHAMFPRGPVSTKALARLTPSAPLP